MGQQVSSEKMGKYLDSDLKTKVLITSIGSRVGQCLLASLQAVRERLMLYGLNSLPEAPALFECDQAFLSPLSSDSEAYLKYMRLLLQELQPELVIPARDEELPLLSQLAEDFPQICFFAPPAGLVDVFADKYASWCFAQEQGLSFAPSSVNAEQLDALLRNTNFPLVAKPRRGGHASQGVFLVQNIEQAHLCLQQGNFVLQALIQPESLSMSGWSPQFGVPWIWAIRDIKYVVEMVLGREGQLLSLVACQTEGSEMNQPVWKRVSDQKIIEVAEAYAVAFARQAYRGVLNLQGKCDAEGRLVVYEMNGRFTGSSNARTAMGHNQVLEAVSHFLWNEAPRPSAAFTELAIKMPQYYHALATPQLEVLRTAGHWEKTN